MVNTWFFFLIGFVQWIIFVCLLRKDTTHNCIILFLQDVLQESTVRIATCLAAQIAKVLQNVLAMQENALVGAKKVGQEKNAIKVILHCFTCSKASFSKRGRGGGGVYMFIFKIRLRFIILKFCLSPNHSVTYLFFFWFSILSVCFSSQNLWRMTL